MIEAVKPRPPRISVLLGETLRQWPTERISFGALVDSIHGRGFGALILLIALPCMIPLPIGFMGGIFGTMLMLIGVQMTAAFDHPWLPKFIRRIEMPKASVEKWVHRLDPWLVRIERLCAPSWLMFHTKNAQRFTGVLLVFLGLELALPVPMTNLPFALALVGYAMALIERDGRWLAVLWVVTLSQLFAAVWFGDWVVLQLGSFIDAIRDFFT